MAGGVASATVAGVISKVGTSITDGRPPNAEGVRSLRTTPGERAPTTEATPTRPQECDGGQAGHGDQVSCRRTCATREGQVGARECGDQRHAKEPPRQRRGRDRFQ
jgi:hypothetical protein